MKNTRKRFKVNNKKGRTMCITSWPETYPYFIEMCLSVFGLIVDIKPL